MFRDFKLNKSLLAIFLLALALRLLGIWHGWPFIYNVDEPALVRSVIGLRFDVNPGHFDWPHLHFYLSFGVLAFFYLVRGFFQMAGLQPVLEPAIGFFWQDPAIYYLIVRIFNACLGALTVVPVYLTGKVLFVFGVAATHASPSDKARHAAQLLDIGTLVGLFSALALAVIPFHVQDSHVATIDIPMVFWLSWSLYFSARILKEGRRFNYVWAGVFAGLAASTKYNGILVLICVGVAHVLRVLVTLERGAERRSIESRVSAQGDSIAPAPHWTVLWRGSRMTFEKLIRLLCSRESLKPIASVLIAILIFFIGTPFALLDFNTFWSFEYPKGVLWQFLNVGQVGSWQALWQNAQKVLWREFFPRDFSLPFWLIVLWSFLELVFGGILSLWRSDVRRGDRVSGILSSLRSSRMTFRGKESGSGASELANSPKPGFKIDPKAWLFSLASSKSRTLGNRWDSTMTLVFIWFFPIVYSLLVIRGVKFSSHYFLPIYPFVVLIIGRSVERIHKYTSPRIKKLPIPTILHSYTPTILHSYIPKFLHSFILLLVFAPAVYSSFRQGLIYARADTRTLASRWVDENVPPESVGAVVGTEDIQIVADGVGDDFIRRLELLADFERYDFVVVTKENPEYAKEKLFAKRFELVQEISSSNPTRRGPDVLIFRKTL